MWSQVARGARRLTAWALFPARVDIVRPDAGPDARDERGVDGVEGVVGRARVAERCEDGRDAAARADASPVDRIVPPPFSVLVRRLYARLMKG